MQKGEIKIPYQSGDRHGMVMLTGKAYMNKDKRIAEFICDCGNIGWGDLSRLRKGRIKSCGCLARVGRTTHGLCYHKLYKPFTDMKQRCYNIFSDHYPNYGGRGIDIYHKWLDDVSVFIKWALDNGWEDGLTLDRIDNNKGYYPENCRWVSQAVQNRNKRTNINITAFGETKCLTDWVKDARCKVTFNQVIYRINVMKWIPELALNTIGSRKNKRIK